MATSIRKPTSTIVNGNQTIPGFTRQGSPVFYPDKPVAELPATTAARKIDEKWASLKGTPGSPKVPGRAGLVAAGDGFYREYTTNHSSIYYSALGVYLVYGAIGQRYAELGGPNSWLGWPLSDEQDFTDGGRASKFQNGSIYWWPDVGAIELGEVSVRYAGMYCTTEMDWDQGSNSDEPYAIFGVIGADQMHTATIRTTIYEDVDSGDSRPDNIELYRGEPEGLSISVLLMEHDDSDPDKYKEAVRAGVEQASKGVVLGIGQIPYVGDFLAPVAEAILKAAAPDITDAINSGLDLKDDVIDSRTFFISAKDMIRMTRVPVGNQYGIFWHLASPLLTGGGAQYTVYFSMSAV
ncbi:hypothetical protein Q4E93_19075 [Flavitalea sp. BT771]|uniref:LGFP repeat-containing protein n=1 Tax=Flavitalea sp. BT771 TaxID=3063329 RepID=UPI0026E1BAD1|nr:hypothetical protein [Flavitalea sp. BT771]MDO6432717.1 hypothetical protein [Flavitalea sp. BT771]MDV6222007.1 hypothetical protein [Flavitalea sp. BT771]